MNRVLLKNSLEAFGNALYLIDFSQCSGLFPQNISDQISKLTSIILRKDFFTVQIMELLFNDQLFRSILKKSFLHSAIFERKQPTIKGGPLNCSLRIFD